PTANPFITYAYDVFGERVSWKKSGTVIAESWDRASLLARDEGGTRTRFVLTPAEIGKVLSQKKGATKRVLAFNAIGTTDCLIDPTPNFDKAVVATAFGVLKG